MYTTRKVTIRSGTEGPHHDPYGYEEYSIVTPGQHVTLHDGLTCYLKVNGETTYAHTPDEVRGLFTRFAELTGGSPADWRKWQAQRNSKCRACGCKRLAWVAGYPGESFLMCRKCDEVVDSQFHPREVE